MTIKISSKALFAVIFLIIISILVSGCTSESSDSLVNDSINSSNFSYNTNQSSDNSSVSPSHYEKKGNCYHVVDGDTIDVEGVGRIRLVGVNTPERGQDGYQEAKDFVISQCLNKMVYLDVDDAKNYDKYGRVLAVVYVGDMNLNAELLKKGYAEIMYIPPSEFDPYSWI
jgi:micrococcal nuclease